MALSPDPVGVDPVSRSAGPLAAEPQQARWIELPHDEHHYSTDESIAIDRAVLQ
jgi:hypothetical protein